MITIKFPFFFLKARWNVAVSLILHDSGAWIDNYVVPQVLLLAPVILRMSTAYREETELFFRVTSKTGLLAGFDNIQ